MLVVEDDPSIRELVADLLVDEGYAVLQAENGRQGLSLALEHVPSVIMVDQVLPELSGLEMLEQLHARRTTRHIPVILVSGLAQSLAEVDHRADRVLAKPFDIDVLLTHIQSLSTPGAAPDQ
ncbi:MAG: response regulator [Chloroflexota bacterium]|nr:response regulator [Chloroflexota bacterium]